MKILAAPSRAMSDGAVDARSMTARPSKLARPVVYIVALVILSGCYLAIAGSTVSKVTVQWDEFTDLVIASALSEHPLSGHSWDGSQGRFPMYVTAVASRIMEVRNPSLELLDVLPVSRRFSIVMTILAMWGTFILGQRLFDHTTGLLAAALFVLSPFVLQFGKDALTQGDAFTAAPVVFAVIAFERFDSARTTFWLASFALFLALAIAAKFFLIVLIPAFITYQALLWISRVGQRRDPSLVQPERVPKAHISWPFLFLALAAGLLTSFALGFSLARLSLPAAAGQPLLQIARIFWFGALVSVSCSFCVAIKEFWWRRSRPDRQQTHWRLIGAWTAILSLTFAVALAVFPAHIFNVNVVPTLFERLQTMDGNSDRLATSLDSVRLYFGLLLFKLGLPLGVATLFALVWATWRATDDTGLLLISLILLYYGLLLIILPLQQPFWLMAVYPLVLLVLSSMLVHLFKNSADPLTRRVWAGGIIIAIAWLMVGLYQVYPAFGLYGYELIGDRWLGKESRGYRKVVVVTNDGSTEAIDWLRDNVPADSTVLSYLDDVHLLNYVVTSRPLLFDFKHALQYTDPDDLAQELAKADYVVTRVINESDLPSPLCDPSFARDYGPAPTYEVIRGRGIYRMPVIQIHQRHTAGE